MMSLHSISKAFVSLSVYQYHISNSDIPTIYRGSDVLLEIVRYPKIRDIVNCCCCDRRIEPNNQRPFRGIALRLFVSARTNMCLPDSGSICNACRMCYFKWRNNTEFVSVLDRLEKESDESIMDTDDKVRFSNYIRVIMYRLFFLE